jgi:hypothetical protein
MEIEIVEDWRVVREWERIEAMDIYDQQTVIITRVGINNDKS